MGADLALADEDPDADDVGAEALLDVEPPQAAEVSAMPATASTAARTARPTRPSMPGCSAQPPPDTATGPAPSRAPSRGRCIRASVWTGARPARPRPVQ